MMVVLEQDHFQLHQQNQINIHHMNILVLNN